MDLVERAMPIGTVKGSIPYSIRMIENNPIM